MTNKTEDKGYTHFPVWTKEIRQWLVENTNKMGGKEAWELFQKNFPDVKTTKSGFCYIRQKLRITVAGHGKRTGFPLYSERERCGYSYIKVALFPSVYVPKAKWVYMETHPEEIAEIKRTDAFYFADGDNRNFDWKNILKVQRREQAVFQIYGGVVKGNPDATRLNLINAKLKLALLDKAETIKGMVIKAGNCRVFRDEANRKSREWRKNLKETPEGRKHLQEIHKRQAAKRRERRIARKQVERGELPEQVLNNLT